jgi:hypothetical protein
MSADLACFTDVFGLSRRDTASQIGTGPGGYLGPFSFCPYI